MLKDVTYNTESCGEVSKSRYSRERVLIQEFMARDDKTMCFEYDNAETANKASHAMTYYITRNNLPVRTSPRANCIFFTKKEKKDV